LLGIAILIGLISELGIDCNPEMAVRLIGATREVHTRLGVQPFGPVAKRVALVGQGLRQLLGAEEFERGLAAGRRLTLPEAHLDALTLAREGCAYRTPILVKLECRNRAATAPAFQHGLV
jgi:hypothetical protein